MSTKAPAKKPASKNAALDKAAADLRKLTEKKKPAAKKKAPTKENQLALPSVTESAEEIKALLKKHVVLAPDFTSLRVKDETEIGEFLPIYDFVRAEAGKAKENADRWQFVEGDLFNEGKRLFRGEFSVMMAKEGRPVGTLKKLGSISDNIDTSIRNLHPGLTWSHVAEVAKVESEITKREILEEAAKKLEAGESVSVKDIRAEADKHKPKKERAKKGKAKVPPYEMTADEQSVFTAFQFEIITGKDFAEQEKKNLRALFPKLTGADKKAATESLELLAELYALLK